MKPHRLLPLLIAVIAGMAWLPGLVYSQKTPPPVQVEGQPLAANVNRLLQALAVLGSPLPRDKADALQAAIKSQDGKKLQELLDPHVLVFVNINPESRVKAARGPALPILQQGGYTPVIIKVSNDSTVTKPLRVQSPQAGPIFSGGAAGKFKIPGKLDKGNFLDVELYTKQPLTENLSGLKVEYALVLIHASEAGKREATLSFDVGQGSQDLGFRGEVPVLFEVRPAIPVKLIVKDYDGKPTTGRFTFRDAAGRVYPPQAKRLAPDFFFQDQVDRHDGGTVLLPPGELTMTYGRGPEYRQLTRKITVPDKGEATVEVKLDRWVNTMDFGFFSGDHHIHAAGCAHYTNPTEGVFADDMFLHVKGEALNVGCNLTWGPCFEFQRQFFTGAPHKLSEPFTVLRYDIEVSGFGSQALGHVCLLNLKDQEYPGSDGTKERGWPTWTTPLMRWAKKQGAVTGYAHSASGLFYDANGPYPAAAAKQLIADLDRNQDGKLNRDEAAKGLIPDSFAAVDTSKDGFLSQEELAAAVRAVANQLPNYAIPPMNGIGAQEICVTTAQGLCDFISAMDTQRVPEWNCWYHIMNCGFPLKVSGETDFPCISGSRVGEGRVYVQLGKVERVDFTAWCEALRAGKSYVSDGYAHAVEFSIAGKTPGEKVSLAAPGKVNVKARVAFASEMPLGTAKGGFIPKGKTRLVELIINGQVAGSKEVPADDRIHDLSFDVTIDRSSWVALRQFPQMHTNPVDVLVAGQPIRASRRSALWCIGTIEQLWRVRGPGIAASERDEANKTFLQAIETYRRIAAESPEGS
jgi:hypothetical protein